jgi:hypothetical protein
MKSDEKIVTGPKLQIDSFFRVRHYPRNRILSLGPRVTSESLRGRLDLKRDSRKLDSES